jgi:recombination protein RecA
MAKRKATDDAQPSAKGGITIDTSLLAGILKETGGQTFELAGRTSYFVDTGSLSLNYICSGKFITGGLPGGKIIEVYGPPATSKSLLGYCALAGAQRMGGIGAYLDCERAGNAEFAQRAGHVDTSTLLLYEPISIEQVEAKIINVTRAIRKKYGPDVPIFWVWDSIGVTPCKREWEEVGLPENPTKEQLKAVGAERPGERARACGDALRKLNPFISEQNATLYIINQTRQAIGALWDDEVTAGGGKALPFYASCRLRTSAQKDIRDAKRDVPLGVNLTFRNKKNRSFTPGLYTKGVQLYFANGINPVGGLLSCLIAAGRVDPSGKAGYYQLTEPWAGGKEVKFRASKERNDVPVDVLLENPSVIDAKSKQEVEEYFHIFGDAMKLTDDENVKEIDAGGDADDGKSLLGDENSY